MSELLYSVWGVEAPGLRVMSLTMVSLDQHLILCVLNMQRVVGSRERRLR